MEEAAFRQSGANRLRAFDCFLAHARSFRAILTNSSAGGVVKRSPNPA